jgi:predicted phosphate transport protein (TIGR00153 family)
MTILFRQSRELEAEIDEYLDLIIQGGLLFRQGVKCFLDHRLEEFEHRLHELRAIEQRGDALRRGIESKLYLHTLIPESRGDVLGLLESADEVLNMVTSTLLRFSIETPTLLDDLNPLFLDLADNAIATVDAMVAGCRAYFRDLGAVRDHIARAQGLREEVNRLAESYGRTVFQRELRLSHKNQLRYFVAHTEQIAEDADDVCDRLAIAAIKRYV